MHITADAVVVGGGHHGLVAAAVLADAGWDVCLLEANDTVGGAVRSAELQPGYVTDLFSAFYPLAHASPILTSLELERHGLRWSHSPAVLAHPLADEQCAVMHRRPEDTAAGLAEHDPRDGDAWLELSEQWQRIREPFLRTLFTATPPVRGPLQLLRRIGTADALRLVRFLLLPARRMGQELFRSEAARLLLAGNAAHTDVPVDSPVSGTFGWLLAMLGQHGGFPVPVGGAGELSAALARRAAAAGAQLHTGERVEHIEVRGGRAVGVRTAAGHTVHARRAVIADVGAPALYRDLLPAAAVPARLLADLRCFEWDTPVVKVNWALDGPIPWRAPAAAAAGTLHLGRDENGLVSWASEIEAGIVPHDPFLLLGQMTTADPSRSPEGTESVWAYTHLPRGISDTAAATKLADRVDEVVEGYAPGFRDRVVGRFPQLPADLEAADANLVQGAVNGGTAQLSQQLVFRPVPGLGRSETPIGGLYLGSAAAHPGGGVHGVCGWLAARAALGEQGARGAVRRRITSAALDLVYSDRRSAR